MRIEFHPAALEEFQAAAQYYAQKQKGLDLRFIEAIQNALIVIQGNPLMWRILEADVRRFLTKIFPYAILYTIESDYILVVAIMHCHRKPGYWRRRLAKE
jgi:plasmid stabilization system protein ParE